MTPTPEQNAKRVPTPRTDRRIAPYDECGHYRSESVRLDLLTAESRTIETELQQLRLAADGMREEVEKAPHEKLCYSIIGWPKPAQCDCWKSKATAAYRAAGEGQPSNPSNSLTDSRDSQG